MERVFIMEDDNGEPIICDCETYLNHVIKMIEATPNNYDLGNKIRMEYDMLKISLIALFK
jgi:hypothetical protein